MKAPTCPYCGAPAILRTGIEQYPHNAHLPDMHNKRFWVCDPCDASVGCHPPARPGRRGVGDGTVPFGTLANAELRAMRKRAHDVFDPLWKSPLRHTIPMRRHAAYAWLAGQMRLTMDECHIALFDVEQCARVIRLSEIRHRMNQERMSHDQGR